MHCSLKAFTFILVAASACWSCSADAAESRHWMDASGKFKVEAQLLTADKELVVLEQDDGELIAVKRDQLSKADREYVQQNYSSEETPSKLNVDSKWKLSDGEVVAGRLLGFGRQELNVKRERGDLWVNDRRLSKLPSAYQKVLPNIVSAIDKTRVKSLADLEKHLADIGGGPYKYTVSGVQLDLTDWGVITIPLTLLATEEAKEVAAGFERWQASQEDTVSKEDRYETERHERLALNSRNYQRRRYQASGDSSVSHRQMQRMELSLLAADAGVTDIWSVQLRPRNSYGYGRTVIVSAQNSLLARQKVVQKFRGWTIGAIAKRSY